MEVYATRYNLIYHLDKIINRQLNSKIDDYIIQNLLFNKSHNRYLTDFSIEQCYYLVEFLNGPKEFILKHGKAVIDNNEYYKFTHPAYHISDQCDRINSDFKNLVIPKRVRNNIGIVEIIRSAPNEILDVNQSTVLIEKLCKDINLKFNIEPKLKFEDFMKIEKDTGPNMKIENDIQTLITRTEQLHKDAEKHISEKAYLLNYKKDNYKPPTYEDFLKYYITDYKCESFIYSGIYNNGSEVI